MSEGPVATGAAMLNAANSSADTSTAVPVADTAPATSNTPPAAPVQNTPAPNNVPAYAKHLEQIPEGLRPMVEPAFKEWDANVNRRFDEVHSQYSPYKQFIDSGLKAEQVREAVDLMNMMVQNPRQIYDAMTEFFGGQADGGQGQVDEPEEFDLGDDSDQAQQFNLESDPRFQQLQQQQQQIAQMLQQQQEQQVAQEADQWVESKVQAATQLMESKGIEPDWDYILGVAGALSQSGRVTDNDQAFDQAVQSWITKADTLRARPTSGSSAPLVMPTNGGTPSTGLPPLNTAKDRKELGSELLKAAFRNG